MIYAEKMSERHRVPCPRCGELMEIRPSKLLGWLRIYVGVCPNKHRVYWRGR